MRRTTSHSARPFSFRIANFCFLCDERHFLCFEKSGIIFSVSIFETESGRSGKFGEWG